MIYKVSFRHVSFWSCRSVFRSMSAYTCICWSILFLISALVFRGSLLLWLYSLGSITNRLRWAALEIFFRVFKSYWILFRVVPMKSYTKWYEFWFTFVFEGLLDVTKIDFDPRIWLPISLMLDQKWYFVMWSRLPLNKKLNQNSHHGQIY